ncbi:ABC transporter B member 11 [Homalodisca vitripennis]|nr:ABC transporter B member 11 [Homalodisca vitripennis]
MIWWRDENSQWHLFKLITPYDVTASYDHTVGPPPSLSPSATPPPSRVQTSSFQLGPVLGSDRLVFMSSSVEDLALVDFRFCRISNYGTIQSQSDNTSDELDKDGGEDVEYKYKSGLLGLFRYATCIDILLLITGIIFSIIHGASFPILAVVFGQMTNAFIHEAVRLQNASIEHENHEKEPLFTDTANPLTDVLYLLGTNIGGLSYSTLAHNRSSEPAGDESQFTSYLAYYSFNYLYIGVLVLVAAFIQFNVRHEVERCHGEASHHWAIFLSGGSGSGFSVRNLRNKQSKFVNGQEAYKLHLVLQEP